MTKRTKLELTRLGKDEEYNLEPRILIERPDLSHDPDGNSENILIHGDNLLALKALEKEFSGQVKCIYIDPPYNTGSRIEADGKEVGYEDGLEHSIRLSMMMPRLKLLHNLLNQDGTIFIQIDDNEFARLYMLMLEIFGEANLKVIVIKMSESTGVKMAHVINKGRIPKLKEYIIIGRKSGIKNLWCEKIPKGSWDTEYKTLIQNVSIEEMAELKEIRDNEERTDKDIQRSNDILGKFEYIGLGEYFKNHNITDISVQLQRKYNNAWRIVRTVSTTDNIKLLADGMKDKISGSTFAIQTQQLKFYRILKNYNQDQSQPRIKILLAEDYLTVHPGDFWDDIKTTGLESEGGIIFKKGKKPEALLKRLIGMSTKSGDLVLDSFLGSGTTAAVAHKMGCRWIGIELGDHAYTHAKVRMDKVIEGEQGGISKTVEWKGGGSYKFYELGPSLLVQDQFGQRIINKELDGDKLIQALCKIENYQYSYDDHGIKHGRSSESSFLHVTTRHINQAIIDDISKLHLGSNEGLLILARTYDTSIQLPSNIRVKKIPKSILNKCEYGKSDYDLPVIESDYDEQEYDEVE